MTSTRSFAALAVLIGLAGSAVATEADSPLETATFAMYCYWTGEAAVGEVEGVAASRIGHLGGREIVQVDFDPSRTDVATLAAKLAERRSIDAIVAHDRQQARALRREVPGTEVIVEPDEAHFIAPKHSLMVRHPALYYLDLDELQAIALNRWSHYGGPMPDVLTADQVRRHTALARALQSEPAPPLEPPLDRSGSALERYRAELDAWLAR